MAFFRDINNSIMNWLPIIFISLFIFNSDNATAFSHTIIGRMIAVLLIVYYTTVNVIFGILMCVIVILFYQSDYAKGVIVREGLNAQPLYLPTKKEMKAATKLQKHPSDMETTD
jgi:hypothetical protein